MRQRARYARLDAQDITHFLRADVLKATGKDLIADSMPKARRHAVDMARARIERERARSQLAKLGITWDRVRRNGRAMPPPRD
ncbi:MAG: hypothetical protein KF699_16990 [Phycisphaeraceae bacterium]|nr:hypothetical protein [Phycisphaeraceae bacterium]